MHIRLFDDYFFFAIFPDLIKTDTFIFLQTPLFRVRNKKKLDTVIAMPKDLKRWMNWAKIQKLQGLKV